MASKTYVKALKFSKWLKQYGIPYTWLGATRHPTVYIKVAVPHPSLEIDAAGKPKLLWLEFRFSNHPWGIGARQRQHFEPHLSIHPGSGNDVGDVKIMVRTLYEIAVGWPPPGS